MLGLITIIATFIVLGLITFGISAIVGNSAWIVYAILVMIVVIKIVKLAYNYKEES